MHIKRNIDDLIAKSPETVGLSPYPYDQALAQAHCTV
jgi:hypothetical protein